MEKHISVSAQNSHGKSKTGKMPNLNRRQLYMVLAATMFIAGVTGAPQVETEQIRDQTSEKEVEQSQRDDKVFALVKIPEEQCGTDDLINTLGTCMISNECSRRGGTASGTCAKGLANCCLITRSCNSQTTLNNTYFVNPDAFESMVGACSLTINRLNTNICQVRLDFISLQLFQPDVDGNCVNDFLTVTGGTTQLPMICGENSGQHMYVDVEPNGGPLKLTIDRRANVVSRRAWNIKVTQITCDSRYRAPDNCLQYYTATSGIVKSFNFANTVPTPLGTRQIANQDYGICIKKAPGYCGIIWERDTTVGQFSFTVSGNVAALPLNLTGDPASSSTGAVNCTTDYVIIPEGVSDVMKQADRYCGLGFPLSVTSTAKPFVMYVKTNGNETADGGNRGFQLIYRQSITC